MHRSLPGLDSKPGRHSEEEEEAIILWPLYHFCVVGRNATAWTVCRVNSSESFGYLATL